MSYLKNTLNFASYSYNASTNTPALAKMKDGTVFEVATAGKVVGTVINGCTLGADSYLLVGDKVVYKNGGHELLSPKIKNGTTINVGAGGLFATFKDANDYISQRVYTGVILNLLSTTVETSSIDVQNPCGGRLVIMGNGFFIDHSGTANTNCTLSGNNIYIDDFKVKANYAGAYALINKGQLTHSNGFYVENINVTGLGFINSGDVVANSFGGTTGITGILATDVVDFRAGATSGIVGYMGVGGKLVAYSINIKGDYRTGYAATCLTSLTPVTAIVVTGSFNNGNCNDLQTSGISCVGFNAGTSCSNYIGGAITTGGGQFNAGASCSNVVGGAINTGGGQFHAGNSCSNYITGAITTGGGQFHAGNSCSNYITGAITTGGGSFNAGASCSNVVGGAITTGGGAFSAGDLCSNLFKGSINTGGGSVDMGTSTNNSFWGTITTGGGVLNCGEVSSNRFNALVACGAGQLNFGNLASNIWIGGATGTGGVTGAGSRNNCNGQPMPAGTPASGTITAAFSRVN